MKKRSICVCLPGRPFEPDWVFGWSDLLIHLLSSGMDVRYVTAQGNNIYQARECCLRFEQEIAKTQSPSDLILWIDSDNPPTSENFDLLLGALDASPEVSIVGGWYRFADPATKAVHIAAGWTDRNVSEQELLEADHLIETEFVGFGMCLMRRKVIEDIGLEKCFEPLIFKAPKNGRTWATDDVGFCQRAREKGHRVFVHPLVFAHHSKILNVPASFVGETPALKET